MKITVDIEQPPMLNRDERRRLEFDRLMEKMEYATDMVQSGMNVEGGLKCLRKCWAWMESLDNKFPEHLRPIKEYILPTIQEFGAEPVSKEKTCG